MRFGYTFEWDDEKARSNERKHGVSFVEARSVFADPLAIERRDDDHSDDEDRSIIVGMSERDRLLTVVYVERFEDTLRIISARRAHIREIRSYEEKARSAR